jgi:hypothetical protein
MTYTYTIGNREHHIQAASYQQAIRAIPYISDLEIISISETNSKGKRLDGRSYRDFYVQTKPKNTPEKIIYLAGEFTADIIRVFGSYSGRSASL